MAESNNPTCGYGVLEGKTKKFTNVFGEQIHHELIKHDEMNRFEIHRIVDGIFHEVYLETQFPSIANSKFKSLYLLAN